MASNGLFFYSFFTLYACIIYSIHNLNQVLFVNWINYIAAYLNSAKGRLSLADASIGERTPTISLKELKSIDIPLPPLEAQRKIGDEYKDLIKELIKLKSKEEMTRKQLENIM